MHAVVSHSSIAGQNMKRMTLYLCAMSTFTFAHRLTGTNTHTHKYCTPRFWLKHKMYLNDGESLQFEGGKQRRECRGVREKRFACSHIYAYCYSLLLRAHNFRVIYQCAMAVCVYVYRSCIPHAYQFLSMSLSISLCQSFVLSLSISVVPSTQPIASMQM